MLRHGLNRYTKYIEIKDNEKNLWNLSLICEAEGMAEQLLKKTKDYQYLPGLAEGSDKMFRQLLHIRCRNILDEVKKKVLYGALKSDAWKKRFELLAGKGWKKSSQNRKEEICLGDEYLKRLETKKYTSGRKGHLEQINDRARLRFIKNYEECAKVQKNRPVLAVVFAQILQYSINPHKSKIFIQIIHFFLTQQIKAAGDSFPLLFCWGKCGFNPVHYFFVTYIFFHTATHS